MKVRTFLAWSIGIFSIAFLAPGDGDRTPDRLHESRGRGTTGPWVHQESRHSPHSHLGIVKRRSYCRHKTPAWAG